MNTQTHVLSVNTGCKCKGCERKVKKLLHKVNGVYATSVDAEQGRVTVTGDVDPDLLVKKLNKSGKHAEIYGSQKGVTVLNNKNTGQFETVNNELKSLQTGKNEKKAETKGELKEPEKETAVQKVIQEMKAPKDSNLPVEMKVDDHDHDFTDGEEEDDEGVGKEPQYQKKVVHVAVAGEKKAVGKDKKATRGRRMMSMMGKAMGGKSEGKTGNNGGGEGKVVKKGGGGGEGKVVNKGGGGGPPEFEVTDRRSAGKLPAAEGGQAPAQMVNVSGGPGGGGVMGPMGSVAGPYQQPQYTALNPMMSGGGDRYHPGLYGPSAVGYDYAPPLPPPVHHDPATSMFSDENPDSCRVM